MDSNYLNWNSRDRFLRCNIAARLPPMLGHRIFKASVAVIPDPVVGYINSLDALRQ